MALVCATAAGCGRAPSERDTLPQWTVDATPTLDLGDDLDGATESAGEAKGVTRSPDGGVIVADRASSSLKFFGPNGALVKTVGRKGSGPGEFERLSHLMRCGDSLYVYDSGRYFVYSLDGERHREFRLAGGEAGARAYRTACNAQGVMLSYAYDKLSELPSKSSVTRKLVPYWLSRADGSLLASLGQFWSSERWASIGDKVSGTGPLPLGKQPVVAVGQSRAYVGLADSFAIDVYGLDGHRLSTIRHEQASRQSTPADVARFKLLDTLGRSAIDIARIVSEWNEMRFPPTLPPYSAMVVDADDNLWVQSYPSGHDSVATWLGFTPTGAAMARLRLPRELDVAEIGADYVLGTETDPQTGIKRVKRFLIRRGM